MPKSERPRVSVDIPGTENQIKFGPKREDKIYFNAKPYWTAIGISNPLGLLHLYITHENLQKPQLTNRYIGNYTNNMKWYDTKCICGDYDFKNCSQCCATRKILEQHENVKSFQCASCKKKFSDAGKLKEHKLVHTEVKSYKCKSCEIRFSLPSNLRQHHLTHTKEKPLHSQKHCHVIE